MAPPKPKPKQFTPEWGTTTTKAAAPTARTTTTKTTGSFKPEWGSGSSVAPAPGRGGSPIPLIDTSVRHASGSRPGGIKGLITGFQHMAVAMPAGIAGMGVETGKSIYNVTRAPYKMLTHQIGPGHGSLKQQLEEEVPAAYHIAQSAKHTVGDIQHPSRLKKAWDEGTLAEKLVEDAANLSVVLKGGGRLFGATAAASEGLTAADVAAITGERLPPAAAGAATMPAMAVAEPTATRSIAAVAGSAKEYLGRFPAYLREEASVPFEIRGKGLAGRLERAAGEGAVPETSRLLRAAGTAERVGGGLRAVGSLGEQVGNAPIAPYQAGARLLGRGADFLNPAVGAGFADLPKLAEGERSPGVRGLLSEGAHRVGERMGGSESRFRQRLGNAMWSYGPEGRQFHSDLADIDHRTVEAQKSAMSQALVVEDAVSAKFVTPEEGALAGRIALFNADQQLHPLLESIKGHEGDPEFMGHFADVVKEMYADREPSMRPTMEDVSNLVAYRNGDLPGNVMEVAKAAEERQRTLSGIRQEIQTDPAQWEQQAPDPRIPGAQSQYVRADDGSGRSIQNVVHPEQLGDELMPHVIHKAQQAEEVVRNQKQRVWEKESTTYYQRQRVADAYTALREQLPPQPLQREARAAGRFEGQQKAERAEYRDRQVELNRAINEYVKISEGPPSAASVEALNRLDRAEAALVAQREKVTQLEGRVDTTHALGRASGDIEEGPPRLPGETPAAYATRMSEWKMEQSLARLEGLNEHYGFNQNARPDVEVAGSRAQLTDIVETAKRIASEQAEQARGRIEQLGGGDRPAIAPPEGRVAGGEFNWWDGLDPDTKSRLLTEGFVRPETVIDEAKGRRRIPNPEKRILPDDFAGIINSRLGTEMSVDEAMGVYIDAIRERWGISQKSDHVLDLTAEQMGLSRTDVTAAVRGKISDYAGLLESDANTAIDELDTAMKGLDPEQQAAFSDYFDTMRLEDGGAISLDNIEELLKSFFPQLDVGSQEGLLAAIHDRVDIDALGDWLRGGSKTEFPAQLRAKIEALGPEQYRQRGRIAGEITGERNVTRSLVARYRDAMASVDKALAQGEQAQAAAEERMGAAQERLEGASPVAGPVRPKTGKNPYERRQWYDADGVLHQAEMSPAERMMAAQVRAETRAAESELRMNRAKQSLDRTTAKIAEMPAELARSLQTRMVDDVNARGVKGIVNAVRSGGAKLGSIIGRGDSVSLTGLLSRMSAKYHIYDDVLARLTEMQDHIRSGGDHWEEYAPGGVQSLDPQLRAADMADAFEHALAESGQVFDHIDRVAWNDSKHADILLQEIQDVLGDNQGELAYNAPFRVMDVVNAYGDWNMPAEAAFKVRTAYDRYHASRVKFLELSIGDVYGEAMPSVYRQMYTVGKREFRSLVTKAEELNKNRPGSGDLYLEVAESIPATLQMLVDAGVDPVHILGGPADQAGRGGRASGGVTGRKVNPNKFRKEGLRELSIDAYARVEAKRAESIAREQRDTWIANRYGMRAGDIPEVAAMTEEHRIDTGEHPTPGMIDETARQAGYVPFESVAKPGQQTLYIRKQIHSALEINPWGDNVVLNGVRWVNQKFKSWVLAASTRWLTGNVFGNIIMAYANAGVGPVQLLRQMRRVAKAAGGWKEIWKNEGVYEGAPAQLTQHGLTTNEFRLRWGGTEKMPTTPFGRGIRFSYRVNEFVDNMTRNAVYYTKLGEGVPKEAAMQTVLRSLGDYTRMGKLERNLIREIVPFYSWLRHSTMAAFRLPITSPSRAAFMLNLSNIFTDPDELDSVLRFAGGKMPLGGNLFLDLGGSYSPYPEMSDDQFTPFDPRSLPSQMSPAIKLPITWATGIDLNTLTQASRPADTRNRGDFGSDTATPGFSRILKGDLMGGLGTIGWQATQQAPTQIRSLRDLALGDQKRYGGSGDPYEGTDANKGRVTSILKMLGLPYVYTLPRDDLEKADAKKKGG